LRNGQSSRFKVGSLHQDKIDAEDRRPRSTSSQAYAGRHGCEALNITGCSRTQDSRSQEREHIALGRNSLRDRLEPRFGSPARKPRTSTASRPETSGASGMNKEVSWSGVAWGATPEWSSQPRGRTDEQEEDCPRMEERAVRQSKLFALRDYRTARGNLLSEKAFLSETLTDGCEHP
jgi:hypothetical protein